MRDFWDILGGNLVKCSTGGRQIWSQGTVDTTGTRRTASAMAEDRGQAAEGRDVSVLGIETTIKPPSWPCASTPFVTARRHPPMCLRNAENEGKRDKLGYVTALNTLLGRHGRGVGVGEGGCG